MLEHPFTVEVSASSTSWAVLLVSPVVPLTNTVTALASLGAGRLLKEGAVACVAPCAAADDPPPEVAP